MRITLPWASKMRDLKKMGLKPKEILDIMMTYGRKEENRITREFEKEAKRRKQNEKSD